MQLKRFQNILAIKTDDGRFVGFHATNMQVAQLDQGVWNAMAAPSTELSEERAELEAWNLEIDPKAQDAHLSQQTSSVLVNVAQICNLKCSYCAAGGDGTFGDAMKHVDLGAIEEQILRAVHDLPEGRELNVTFFGGEPLLAPDVIQSLARSTRLQCAGRGVQPRFSIVTNGTLVTPELAEMLASLKCHVTLSLDGPPQINDLSRKTRGGRGSTALALRGLDCLQAVRERLGSLSAAAVFGRHHTAVVETYRFLREFNFDSIKFDFAAERDDAEASSAYASELVKAAELAFLSGGEQELRRINLFDGHFQALDEQRRLKNHCGAGKSLLAIDGKGRATACQWFIGLPEEQLNDGPKFSAQKLENYADPLVELNNCGSCWARHLCGGGCMYVNSVKTGAKHKKDIDFCQRTKTTIAKAIELYAQARYQISQGDGRETHQQS